MMSRRFIATLLSFLILLGVFVPAKARERRVFAYYGNGIAQFLEDGHLGLINAEGKVILPAEYDFISPRYSEGLAVARNESGTTWIDKSGNIVFKLPVDNASPFKNGYAWVGGEINGSRGIHMIDRSGGVLSIAGIIYATDVSDGLAFCVRQTEGEPIGCYVNTNGEVVFDLPRDPNIPYEYEDYGVGDRLYDKSFNDGLALFHYQSCMYLIDKQGNMVRELPARYDYMNFSFGPLSVARDPETRLYGYINTMGQYIVPPVGKYGDPIYPMLEERGLLEIERGLWRCYDEAGQLLFEIECDSISPFYQGYAAVRSEIKESSSEHEIGQPLSEVERDAFAVLFATNASLGNDIATNIFDNDETEQSPSKIGSNSISPFHQWGAASRNETDIIDKEGNVVLRENTAVFWQHTHNYSPMSDGLIAFEEDGKYGFIDIHGERVIAPQFEELDVFTIKEYSYMMVHFFDGLAKVKKDGLWYFINTRGEIVAPW